MINKKDCLKTRKVSRCEDCCRYYDCKHHTHTLFSNFSACLRIGYEILEHICIDFKRSWKKGYANRVESISNYLRSEMPTILTAEKTNGIYLLESLQRVCTDEYGTLESCHEKMIKKVKGKLKELEERRRATTSRKEKFELTNKINEAKGEINF